MLDFRKSVATFAAVASVAGLLGAAPASAQTLNVVMHSDLKILDPIWTTAYIVRNHGYLVWDTLFAMDEKLEVKPQMVDKFDVSADKLTYTFTLRDGLEWHDGKPVTAADCIASIKRWGAKDSMGQSLMARVGDMKAVNDKTFTLTLKEPYGLVLQSLGKPSSNVPFMMPETRRRNRSRRADQGRGRDRLRPVHLQARRMEAGREDGLRQEPEVQAAQLSPPRAWPAARSSSSTASNGKCWAITRPRSTRS